jgi:Tol biopolymer transport system component
MTALTHEQARKFLLAAADGLLADADQPRLAEHLRTCADCQRYQTELANLENRLQAAFGRHRQTAPRVGPVQVSTLQSQQRRNNMHARLVSSLKLAFGSVILTGLIILMVTSLRNLKNVQNLSTSQPALQTVSSSQIVPTPVSESPTQAADRLLAYVSTEDGNSEIYVMKTAGSGAVNLTNHPAYDGNPSWSPDGSRLAFESERDGNRKIYVLNLADGGLTLLTQLPGNNVLDAWSQANWSPDGSHLLFRNDQSGKWQTYVVTTDGTGVTHQLPEDETESFSWSPDGTHLAYIADNNQGSQSNPKIYLIAAEGGQRQSVPLPASFFMVTGGLRWAKDGKSIFYQVSQCSNQGEGCGLPLSYLIYQASLGESEPRKLAAWSGEIADYAVDETGLTFIGTNRQPTIQQVDTWQWVRVEGKALTNLAQWKNLEAACQTPDERNFAQLVGGSSGAGRLREKSLVLVTCVQAAQAWLYAVNADGSEIKKVSNTPISGEINLLEWSPDGQFLTFTVNDQQGVVQFFAWDILAALQNPATQPVPLPIRDGKLQPVPFSAVVKPVPTPLQPAGTSAPVAAGKIPSGDLIAFESDQGGIYLMKKDGSGQTKFAEGSSPVWSPDGSAIAFVSSRENLYGDLYVMRADGSDLKKLAPLGWSAVWSPDGKQLAAYRSDDPQNEAKGQINLINADGSALRSFPLDFTNEKVRQSFQLARLRWTADGKFLQFLAFEQPFVQNDLIGDKWKIYQFNLEDSSLTVLAESKTPILEWTGSGSALMVLTREELAWQWMRIQGQKRTVLARWQPKTGAGACASWSDFFTITRFVKWSPNGKKLLIAAQCSDDTTWLYLENSDGTQISQLTNYPLRNFQTLTWASDGKSLIFSADLEAPGNLDLYLLDLQSALKDPSNRPIRLTTSGFSETNPDWQPGP